MFYFEAVNYYFETYAMVGVIAETEGDMMQLTQLSYKSPTGYSEALWNKAFQSNRKYDECVLKVFYN